MDVGVLQRDKKSLEKSMDAVDARNEELEACAQKLKVSQGTSLLLNLLKGK